MAILLLEQIASLFIIMISGYAAVKLGLLKSEQSKVLTVLSVYIILPCVIITSFQIQLTDQILNGFLLALAAAVLIHVLLLFSVKLIGNLFHLNEIERGSLIYSNAGNLIIPIVTAVLGDEWVIYASAFLCVQLVFTWTHGQTLLSGTKTFSWKKILLNCNLISVMIGIVLMITKIRIPGVLLTAMSSLGKMLGPMGMLMVGMLLGGMALKRIFINKRVYFISFLKMIAVPGLVLLFLKLSGMEHLVPEGKTILFISFLAVMTPSAALVTQLAQLYGKDADHAGAINVMTTVFCIATMPLMSELYMRL